MADRLALFTGGQFADPHAKTAHGILRYGPREVVAVVDAAHGGPARQRRRPVRAPRRRRSWRRSPRPRRWARTCS